MGIVCVPGSVFGETINDCDTSIFWNSVNLKIQRTILFTGTAEQQTTLALLTLIYDLKISK